MQYDDTVKTLRDEAAKHNMCIELAGGFGICTDGSFFLNKDNIGEKTELTPYLYMYDSVDRFIRDASEIGREFIICKDLREDHIKLYGEAWVKMAEEHGHKQWFPTKGDRVRLVWEKPNKGIMTEFGPVEVTAKLVLVDDESKQVELTQSVIIECIKNETGVVYARAGAGAAFYWSDCPTELLMKAYDENQSEEAKKELIRRGVIEWKCSAENIGCKCSTEEFSHPDLCLAHFVAFEIWIANGWHEVYESQTLTQEEKREAFREALKILSPDDTAEIIERKFANQFKGL